MGPPARILIADDDRRTRAGLRALLSTHPGFEVAGEAIDGQDTLVLVERYHPDAVLLDLHMPLLDGIQTTRLLKERWPEIAVVVLSMDTEQQTGALAAGADAFVGKTEEPHEIINALQRVCRPGSTGAGAVGDRT